LLAPVIERDADLPVDLVTHFSRDADATGFDQCLQPRRDIYVVTEEFVALDDYFAQIDADAT
jgi:hypothetical protein